MIWAMNNYNGEQFLNVGTGVSTSIKDLAEMIAAKIRYKGELVFDTSKPEGMMKKCLDVSLINSYGWYYTTTLKGGLEKTIEHYLEMKK
jgi:GDP-L-fucose synthase